MEKTTIQINVSTLDRLKALKQFERQSYDELLQNIIDNFDEEVISEEEINEIQEGLKDIKEGRTKSIEEVAKELRVVLK